MKDKQLLERDLPKWPGVLINGDPVSREQALNIIAKTDSFIDSLGEFGGNDSEWNAKAKSEMGVDDLTFEESCAIGSAFRESDLFVPTVYLRNDWLSTSYIHGPSGWCSPSGEIYMNRNVGKWPSLIEIQEDFERIAKAFPFLKATAVVFDHEYCEEEKKQVLTFFINKGEVTWKDVPDWKSLVDEKPLPDDTQLFIELLKGTKNLENEHGVAWKDCLPMFARIKSFVKTWKAKQS